MFLVENWGWMLLPLVKRHNGQLTFASEVGIGTTFHLEFPDPYQVVPVLLFELGQQQFYLQADAVVSF